MLHFQLRQNWKFIAWIFHETLHPLNYLVLILRLQGKNVSLLNVRFNRIAWTKSANHKYGIIAGALEDGTLDLYDPNLLIHPVENTSSLIMKKKAHSGSVRALDFNPFQGSLLATGGPSAELFIWDLNNPEKPYTPGSKSQKLDDITCVAWNRQVQHIMASSSVNGCSVIWDLKRKAEVIHLSVNSKRAVTSIAWNPDVATQLVTASEDDGMPVIYMWDLRNAHAPEKILKGHTNGVLSLSWCPLDSEYLLSCGKDNRTLLWNPNDSTIIGEFPTSRNWVFDVQWCPKNPDFLLTSSFDGKISFYSIQSRATERIPIKTSNDPFSSPTIRSQFDLPRPPKWMRRPAGAIFAFGNLLVNFCQNAGKNLVSISRVASEPLLVKRSRLLQNSIATKNFSDFFSKIPPSVKSETLNFLQKVVEKNCRENIVGFLGFQHPPKKEAHIQSPKESEPMLSTEAFSYYSNEDENDKEIIKFLVAGNFSGAVDICLKLDRLDDALVFAGCGGEQLLNKTYKEFFNRKKGTHPYIRVLNDVMNSNFMDIVKNSDIRSWKETLSLICSYSSTEDLSSLSCALADRLKKEEGDEELLKASVLAYIVGGDFGNVVNFWANELNQSASKYETLVCNPLYASDLQAFMEKVEIYKEAIGYEPKPEELTNTEALSKIYYAYADMIATEGETKTALRYLSMLSDEDIKTLENEDKILYLKDRIYNSLEKSDLSCFTEPAVAFAKEIPDFKSKTTDNFFDNPVQNYTKNNGSVNSSVNNGYKQTAEQQRYPQNSMVADNTPDNSAYQSGNQLASSFNNQQTYLNQQGYGKKYIPPGPTGTNYGQQPGYGDSYNTNYTYTSPPFQSSIPQPNAYGSIPTQDYSSVPPPPSVSEYRPKTGFNDPPPDVFSAPPKPKSTAKNVPINAPFPSGPPSFQQPYQTYHGQSQGQAQAPPPQGYNYNYQQGPNQPVSQNGNYQNFQQQQQQQNTSPVQKAPVKELPIEPEVVKHGK
jgi:protein transport protein SEC31